MKLYFKWGSMGSGKSIELIRTAYNYEERGLFPLIFTSAKDNREGIGYISTRIPGFKRAAIPINENTNIIEIVETKIKENGKKIDILLIDEVQFLSKEHILEIAEIVDNMKIPAICYGLRTDFKGNLFEGSRALFENADYLDEIKSMCWCGRKASHNARVKDGKSHKTWKDS